MAARAGTGRQTRDLIRFKIVLMDTDPEIWRLLELDADLTLDRVHEALQVAMGWRDSHLHLFEDTDPDERLHPVEGEARMLRRWMTHEDLEELDGLPETEWTLRQVLTEESSPLYYEYDFGDRWIHRLEFVEQLAVPATEPVARVERGDATAVRGEHDRSHGKVAVARDDRGRSVDVAVDDDDGLPVGVGLRGERVQQRGQPCRSAAGRDDDGCLHAAAASRSGSRRPRIASAPR